MTSFGFRPPISSYAINHVKKLWQRFIGTYTISAKISSQAYRLRLPLSMQCYNVFQISKLRPCLSPDCPPDTVPARMDAPQDKVIVDAILDFRIVSSSTRHRRGPSLKFLTHLEGCDATHDSWEPNAGLNHVHALHNFERSSYALACLFR
jgi:hypothetical protein